MRRPEPSASQPTSHQPGIAIPAWLPTAALGVYGAFAVLAWSEASWRPDWDSGIYLLTASSLAAGEGYSYLGEPFFLRPPGLSWLLSFTIRDGAFDAALLSHLMMACGAAAVAGIYHALKRDYGRDVALIAALLTGCSPLFVDSFNWVLSDLPFLALLFPAFSLLDRGAAREPRSIWLTLSGALLLLGACMLRTAALAALPGVFLVYGRQRQGWGRLAGAVPVALVCLGIAPWLIHANQAAELAPRPSEQLLLFDYMTALLHVDPGDPASATLSAWDWGTRLTQNGAALVRDLAVAVTASPRLPVQAGLLALAAVGALFATRPRRSIVDSFAIVYALLLIGYFTHHPRLALPLVPVCLAYIVSALRALPRLVAGLPRLRSLGPAARILGLVVLLSIAFSEVRAFPARLDVRSNRLSVGTQGQVWSDLERAASWLRSRTPPDARVLAGPAPSLSLLSQRRVYSFRFRREPDLLGRLAIDYAVVMPWNPPAQKRRLSAAALREWTLPSDLGGTPIRILQIGDR